MGVGSGLYMCDVVVKRSRSLFYLLISSRFKVTRPQQLSPLVTTGLLGVNRTGIIVSSKFIVIRPGRLTQHLLTSCL